VHRDDWPTTWLQEPFQVSKYAVNEYYDWHEDRTDTNRSSLRCLTLTCTLQPAEGAHVETEDRVFELGKGEAVIIHSADSHRATAPTIGERWALTVWAMEPNPRRGH